LYDYDWKKAGEQYRLAMAAEHVPAEVRARCSLNYLLPMGRMQDAIEQIGRALERDPLGVWARCAFSLVLSIGEDYDRALAEAQKAAEMDASHWISHLRSALVTRFEANSRQRAQPPSGVFGRRRGTRRCWGFWQEFSRNWVRRSARMSW
jgi:hypothetical protein